jgi:hypothetical protein
MKRQRRTTRKSKKTKRTRRVQRGGFIMNWLKGKLGMSSSTTSTEPKAVELTTLSNTSSPTSSPFVNNMRNSNVTSNNNPVPLTSTLPEGVVRPLPSAPPASGGVETPPASGGVETPSANIYRPLPSAPPSPQGGSRKKKSKRSKRSMRKKSRKGC